VILKTIPNFIQTVKTFLDGQTDRRTTLRLALWGQLGGKVFLKNLSS